MLRKVGTLAVVTAVATIVSTAINLYFTGRQVDLAERAQVYDRFDKAQTKLKSQDVSDQMSGIAELQRAVKGAPDDARLSAIDQLVIFLRLNAHSDQTCGTSKIGDIANSALTAIGQLNNGHEPIDLSNICLAGAKATDVNLSNVHFTNANLSGATFVATDLSNARFDLTKLTGTEFILVDLTSAVFCFADIADVDFRSGTFVHTALDVRGNPKLRERAIDLSQVRSC